MALVKTKKGMKYLFITHNGDGLALASIIKREGHTVVAIDTAMNKVYDGLLDVIRRRAISRILIDQTVRGVTPDVVVFCKHNGWGTYVKSLGLPILCGGDVVKVINKDKLPPLIQDVEGDEQRVGFWWNGSKSSAHFQGKMYRRMMNEDLGAECECSGSIVERTTRHSLKMADTIIPLLRKTDYRGPVCADVVGGKVKHYRLGLDFDMLYGLLELYRDSVGEFIFGCASGFEGIEKWYDGIAITTLFSYHPYPRTENAHISLTGDYNGKAGKHTHWKETRHNGEMWEAVGNHLGCVSARGISSLEARRRVLRSLNRLSIPNLQYRTDIGKNYLRNL